MSVSTDPDHLRATGWVPHEVILSTVDRSRLQIRQTGHNPSHFEIMPLRDRDLTEKVFLDLLDNIRYISP